MEVKIYIYFAIITLLNLNVSARNIMKINSYFHRENDMHDEYFAGKESLKISQPALAENADSCNPNPCKHEGTCMPDKDKPKCFCRDNFYGQFCQDLCLCIDGFCERNKERKMVCKCPPEWGLYSNIRCRECDCGSGANCTFNQNIINGEKHCICKEGYSDVNGFCKADCSGLPCKNGGKCKVVGTDIACDCVAPYFSEFCERNPCIPNPCKNRGTCTPTKEKPKCSCQLNYYGDLCQDKCECKDGFCERNEKGKMVCKCPTEWASYTEKLCKKCDCGNGSNCTFDGGWLMQKKKCICKEGYQDVNGFCKADCSSQPCKNGGKCKVVGADIACDCEDPYFGDFCEKNKNSPCLSSPCKNGGTCDDSSGKAVCKCVGTFIGPFCETDACIPNPCLHDGKCKVLKGKVNCTCLDEYSGEKCENAACECKNGYCEKDDNGTMVCKCPPEWGQYGKKSCKKCYCGKDANCTYEVGFMKDIKQCICTEGYKDVNGICQDLCFPNPCMNAGVCSVVDGKVSCLCKEEFIGQWCEQDLCSPNPCRNGGTCATKSGKVRCTCQNQFIGEKCETDMCHPNPCQNGGTCGMQNGKLRCFCNDLFTGEKCERGRCTPNPCKNGGTCAMLNGNMTCFCKDSFTGDHCESERTTFTDSYTSTAAPDRTRNNSNLFFTSQQPHNFSTDFTASVSKWDRPSSSVSFTTAQHSSRVPDNETFPSDGPTTSSIKILTSTARSTKEENISFTNWGNKTTTETSLVTQDLCSLHHCMNGGICREVNYRSRCFCISPFSGEFCEKDPCTPRPCVNGGTCGIKNTTFYCNCNEPFSGDFCEKDPCTANPCQNGGTCFLSGYTSKCICKEDFTGDKCESDAGSDGYMLILAAFSLFIFTFSTLIACLVFKRCMSKG